MMHRIIRKTLFFICVWCIGLISLINNCIFTKAQELTDNIAKYEICTEGECISGEVGFKVGDIVTFGSYEQDGNYANGKEPIEWYVLEISNGRVLLLSKYVLDMCVLYKSEEHVVTWHNSYLRYWMNNTFKNEAFSPVEQARIPYVDLSNTDSSEFYKIFGYAIPSYKAYVYDTKDQVFALSYQEVIKYCGVRSLQGAYWGYSSPLMQAQATPELEKKSYTHNREVSLNYYNQEFAGTGYPVENIGNGGYRWWLRSPGNRVLVSSGCEITSYGLEVSEFGIMGGERYATCARRKYGDMWCFSGVRPAIYVNL